MVDPGTVWWELYLPQDAAWYCQAWPAQLMWQLCRVSSGRPPLLVAVALVAAQVLVRVGSLALGSAGMGLASTHAWI